MEFFYIIDAFGGDKYLKCIESIRLPLLDMFGRGYVIEHVMAALKTLQEEEIYKKYISNALKYIVQNTAGQEEKMLLKVTYDEIINPVTKEQIKESEEKAEKIIDNMKEKLRNLGG